MKKVCIPIFVRKTQLRKNKRTVGKSPRRSQKKSSLVIEKQSIGRKEAKGTFEKMAGYIFVVLFRIEYRFLFFFVGYRN
jgi:hypothetical protein